MAALLQMHLLLRKVLYFDENFYDENLKNIDALYMQQWTGQL